MPKGNQIFFNIKEVAKKVGVVPATIRNWEKKGLFIAKRGKNNYRIFDFQDIELLSRIKKYSSEDKISISMIKQLIANETTPVTQDENHYYKEIYHDKLKKYREKSGLTLEDVSTSIGISTSYLSRIEQGNVNVSYEILDKLAHFYGESTIRFFDVKNENSGYIIKKNEGKKLESSFPGVIMESLTDTNENAFHVIKFKIEPNSGDFNSHTHNSGGEFIYVLTGILKVTLDEETECLLYEGDSIHFKSERNHRWHNPGEELTEIVWVHSYI